ncbi:MAG: hypothetical protein IK080_06705 [Clostridia bacterium]|nr:hypothetical protein [Clostridia bacterium]
MTIHISAQEPRLDAYYREYVNLVAQRRKVMQHPTTWWLRNWFLNEWIFCVIAVFWLAIAGWILFTELTFVPAIVLACFSAVLLLISAARLIRMYRMCSLLKRNRKSLDLTLDADGVEVRDESGQTIRIKWEGIAFFRVFKESACFFPYEMTGALIAVSPNHVPEILQYLRENKPDVRIIGA